MDIKYCKNCVNFTPYLTTSGIRPDQDYSWGYCRMIMKLKLKDQIISFIQRDIGEVVVEKEVAANQVIIVNDQKIRHAFGGLSDMFKAISYTYQLSSLDILKNLNYVKCKNCYHLFASNKDILEKENNYTCPICFHTTNYELYEHFKKKPDFLFKE